MVKRRPLPRSRPHERIPIAWFQRKDYARIREIVGDPREVPVDYDQWRERTEYFERYWKRRGHLTVRVVVDPDELLAWCAARADQPGGNAIKSFVYERVVPGTRRR